MQVRGRKVTVVGMGETCIALVRLLLREGAHPFVTESNNAPKIAGRSRELEALGVPYEIGGHTLAAFAGPELVISSPGVSPHIAPIQQAVAEGADVIGEMEFAYSFCDSRVLAVTGTNGKTTTTELLRALVAACGHSVVLAGNNAFPFSAAVMLEQAPEFIVLEVSSYQLETAQCFRPWIGAVLNITPDHLARHGSLDHYASVKARMFMNQQRGDVAVINHDDPLVRDMALHSLASVWPFSLGTRLEAGLWLDGLIIRHGSEVVASASDTALPGRHNLQNVLCALTMMRAGGFDWEKTIDGVRGFRGVEHRIEHVAEFQGIDFYNDSKSTNIDSLKVAIESFDRPVVLIAGGEGKGSDYRVLRDLVRERVRKMVTIGLDAPKLEEAFGDLVTAERAEDMADAVERAARTAVSGDVVLLSPACASFDMFDNFEHRGRVYKECVLRRFNKRT